MKFSKSNTKLKKTIALIKKLDLDLPRQFRVFGIPAYKTQDGDLTCPGASSCSGPCFARSGHYLFSARKKIEHENYNESIMPGFMASLSHEIRKLKKPTIIRIHDSGDFHSRLYYKSWYQVALAHPQHTFYAYTKSWNETAHYRYLHKNNKLPDNFVLVYSYGSKHDDKLTEYNQESLDAGRPPLPTSKIFISDDAALQAGYLPSPTDLEAIRGHGKIGLEYHNNKHSRNFKWNDDGSLYNSTPGA